MVKKIKVLKNLITVFEMLNAAIYLYISKNGASNYRNGGERTVKEYFMTKKLKSYPYDMATKPGLLFCE
jgi:hypothetical protein